MFGAYDSKEMADGGFAGTCPEAIRAGDACFDGARSGNDRPALAASWGLQSGDAPSSCDLPSSCNAPVVSVSASAALGSAPVACGDTSAALGSAPVACGDTFAAPGGAPTAPDNAPTPCPELLAPAGSPEAFAAALAAGADAIYCGMGEFNARRKAQNFSDDGFAVACRTAHLAGVRVYVTLNIVIKDEEMPAALELVRRCASLGADAFIVQDWGLFFEIRRLMPQLELHVSTQANVHDRRGAAWCREAGAERVTLARELSLPEIEEASKAGIELEVFAHGSLCFCYSGLCLLSAFTCDGRSANRGLCAQSCRLPYELLDEDGRRLSAAGRARALCPRDNCTIELLPRLLDAGARSLKIEGRMKSYDYVHAVVGVYREQLDDVMAGRASAEAAMGEAGCASAEAAMGEAAMGASGASGAVAAVMGDGSPEDGAGAAESRAQRLKRSFNRDFSTEYLFGRSGDEMMSYERSNNRGQLVGEVLDSRPAVDAAALHLHPDDRRARAAIVRIRLFEPVGAGDQLELRHDDDWERYLLTTVQKDAPAGSVIECRASRAMSAGACVRLIGSQAAFDAADAAVARAVPRKRAVDLRVEARAGKPLLVELRCADDPALAAAAEGPLVRAACDGAATSDGILACVDFAEDSPFEAASIEVELGKGCAVDALAVREAVALACAALEERIMAPYEARAKALGDVPPFEIAARTVETAQAKAACAELVRAAGAQAAAGAAELQPVASVADVQAAADVQAVPCTTGAQPVVGATGAQPAAARTAPARTPVPTPVLFPAAEICVLATSREAAEAARRAGATRVYLAVDDLLAEGFDPQAAAEAGIVPVLDEVSREADHARLDPWVRPGLPVAVGNVSELSLAAERKAVAELRSCVPVHNLACLEALTARGARGVWLSPELSLVEIERLGPHAGGVALGVAVVGRPRVMTSEHCILQAAGPCDQDCARCGLRRRKLVLQNIDGKRLPVRSDVHGRSRLYAGEPLDLLPEMPRLLEAGVTRFLVDGTLCEPDELVERVSRAVRALEAARLRQDPAPRMEGATPGCLYTGVE